MKNDFFFATDAGRLVHVLVLTPLVLILGILDGKALLPWIQAGARSAPLGLDIALKRSLGGGTFSGIDRVIVYKRR